MSLTYGIILFYIVSMIISYFGFRMMWKSGEINGSWISVMFIPYMNLVGTLLTIFELFRRLYQIINWDKVGTALFGEKE